MPTTTILTNLDLAPSPEPNGAATAATLRFFEDAADGANYVALRAPAALASNVSYVLPSAQGAASTFLQNDGLGNLTWAAGGGGGGGGVLYDVAAAQTTATLGNKLFDVAYTGTGTGNAPGALITSTSKGNGNTATGLTLTVDSGSTNSAIQGLVIDATSAAAATTATGAKVDVSTSGAANAFGVTVSAVADAGQLSQALTLGSVSAPTTQGKHGWIRLNSYWEGNSTTPPDGYAVYAFTSQPAGNVTIPGSTTKGRLAHVISSGGLNPITITQCFGALGTYNLDANKGVQLISNGTYWIPFVP